MHVFWSFVYVTFFNELSNRSYKQCTKGVKNQDIVMAILNLDQVHLALKGIFVGAPLFFLVFLRGERENMQFLFRLECLIKCGI